MADVHLTLPFGAIENVIGNLTTADGSSQTASTVKIQFKDMNGVPYVNAPLDFTNPVACTLLTATGATVTGQYAMNTTQFALGIYEATMQFAMTNGTTEFVTFNIKVQGSPL